MREVTKYLEYARLIARYISGDLSEAERTKLETWKAQSTENTKLFERISDDQNRIANQEKMKAVDKDSAWNSVSKATSQIPSKRILFQNLLAVWLKKSLKINKTIPVIVIMHTSLFFKTFKAVFSALRPTDLAVNTFTCPSG